MNDQIRRVRANELIFSEGEVGNCAYLIEHGRVVIFLNKEDAEIPLKSLGENEFFGEMSLIDASPRSASCRALTDCELVVVTKDQLLGRIQAADPVVRLLMKVLLERLRAQNDRFTGKPTRAPVAGAVDPLAQEKKDTMERIGLENRIARGLDQNEFVPFYQPIYELCSGDLKGCEALVRWISGDHEIISPGVFIDVMEESSMILSVGKVIIEKSLADFAKMRSCFTGIEDFFVSINVSGRQFSDPRFLAHLESTRQDFAVPAERIKLELTERIMTEGPQALFVLSSCRNLGYRLGIDDFGTGFSSLQYLAQMPLTDLKIDRSFVMKMLSDGRSLSIIKSLIYLAESLGLNLIAEGIETPEELKMLRRLNVNMGQGYLFSKAISFQEFIKIASRVSARAA